MTYRRNLSDRIALSKIGLVERVIRTINEQCMDRQRFETMQHATRVIEDWIGFFNQQRPHQALKMMTPSKAFVNFK
jgi:putative transposase